MIKTSEWVSLGHPDKMADFISSYLLDRYLEKDPLTRFAVEVQIKDNFVTLGGEITSMANISPEERANFVREAVDEIGYTTEYRNQWGAENTVSGESLMVTEHISEQSPDIAQGVDSSGWGDQGIFHGMAVNSKTTNFMPLDYYLARKVGETIFNSKYAGLDIKTQVTTENDSVIEVIVAVPMNERHSFDYIDRIVHYICKGHENYKLVINGTGRYVRHASMGDCGTTGRKLAVDFYGGNCKIGGGSPWTKDASKADVTLNIYARYKALEYLIAEGVTEVYCSISCCIGKSEIRISYFDGENKQLASEVEDKPPEDIIDAFNLRYPNFANMCRNGLFE